MPVYWISIVADGDRGYHPLLKQVILKISKKTNQNDFQYKNHSMKNSYIFNILSFLSN